MSDKERLLIGGECRRAVSRGVMVTSRDDMVTSRDAMVTSRASGSQRLRFSGPTGECAPSSENILLRYSISQTGIVI